jgi:hypothetical protein
MVKRLGIVLAVGGLALGGLLFWAGIHRVGGPAHIRAAATSGPARLPLDLVPGAAAGYSLRKLRAAYAGAAVNVRRSSDSTTQDIGFAGNLFDAAGFAAFVGGGTAANTDWYDQSGNAADSVQTTAANQPALAQDLGYYGSGTTQGSPQVLAAPNAAPIQGIFATGGFLQVVLRSTQTVDVGSVISKGAWVLYTYPGGGDQQLWWYQKAATTDGFWGTNDLITKTSRHIVTVAYNAATPAVAPVITLDGVTCIIGAITLPVGAVTSDAAFPLELSNNQVINANDKGLGGTIYEALVYKGIPSAGDQEALIANAKAFYGIP